MKDLIVLILDLLIYTYVFGHIYLFWISRLRPSIQKYYAREKRAVAILNAIYRSEVPEFEERELTPSRWSRYYLEFQLCYSTFTSLVPAAIRYIYTSFIHSPFLKRNFPAVMEHISRWDRIGLSWENVNSMWEHGNSMWENDKPKWENGNSTRENDKPKWENGNSTRENDNPTWEKDYSFRESDKPSWEKE